MPISLQEQADLEGELYGKDCTDYQLRNDIQTVNTHGDNRFFLSVVQRTIQPLALCVYPEEWEGRVQEKLPGRAAGSPLDRPLGTTHQPQG